MSWLPPDFYVEIAPARSGVIVASARAMGKCACCVRIARPTSTGRLVVHEEDVVAIEEAIGAAFMRGCYRAYVAGEPLEPWPGDPEPSAEELEAMLAAERRG